MRAGRSDEGETVLQFAIVDETGQLVGGADGRATCHGRVLFIPRIVLVLREGDAIARRNTHVHHVHLQVLFGQSSARFEIRAVDERILFAVARKQIVYAGLFALHQLALLVQAERLESIPNGLDSIGRFQMIGRVEARTFVLKHGRIVHECRRVAVHFLVYVRRRRRVALGLDRAGLVGHVLVRYERLQDVFGVGRTAHLVVLAQQAIVAAFEVVGQLFVIILLVVFGVQISVAAYAGYFERLEQIRIGKVGRSIGGRRGGKALLSFQLLVLLLLLLLLQVRQLTLNELDVVQRLDLRFRMPMRSSVVLTRIGAFQPIETIEFVKFE